MWKKISKFLDLPESFVSITLGFLVVIIAGLLIYNNFISPAKTDTSLSESLEEQLEESAVLPTTHTVSANENLWKIAEKYYGSGYNWVTIASENKISNPDLIAVGQVLSIPEAETISPEREKTLATAATESKKTYIVTKGDSLWNIAVKEYGDGYAWVKIAQANNLTNPDIIHPGNELKLPKME